MLLNNTYVAAKYRFKRWIERVKSAPGLRLLTGRPANRTRQIETLAPPVRPNGMKVVCFGPYTKFTTHAAAETIMLHAMRLRGHETTYIMCDGVMPQCDVYRTGVATEGFIELGPNGEKTSAACRQCRSVSKHALWSFGTPHRQMSEWLSSGDRRKARDWADGLRHDDLGTARYGDWPIGDWVASSVQTHFRCNELDLTNPGVATIFRRYLVGGLLTAFTVQRFVDELRPDLMILFNGRMAPTRVALELAGRLGVRTIVEERGLPNRVRLWENQNCTSLDPLDKLWAQWKDYPLSDPQVQEAAGILANRRLGQGFEWKAFSTPSTGLEQVRRELALDGRPVWLLMTSSIDESGQDGRARGLFPSQSAWVESIVDVARRRSDVQVVVRVHPNVGSDRSIGVNSGEIAYFLDLATRVPENVRVVPSSAAISTYSLMEIADAGFIWHTTAGLEMAAMGKQVFQSGGMFMSGKDFLTVLPDGPDLAERIFAARAAWGPEQARHAVRLALRCAHVLFFRQSLPLPLMRQPEWYDSVYDFTDNSCLLPGRTSELDHIAEILESSRSLYEFPPDANEARTTDAEDAVLARMLDTAQADKVA